STKDVLEMMLGKLRMHCVHGSLTLLAAAITAVHCNPHSSTTHVIFRIIWVRMHKPIRTNALHQTFPSAIHRRPLTHVVVARIVKHTTLSSTLLCTVDIP